MRVALNVMLLLVVGIAGCAGSKAEPEIDAGQLIKISIPERPPYTIACGDLLSIKFFYYPSYDVNVRVRPDGMVTVPLLGEVKAEGMRPAELESLIRARYAQVLAEPEVSVIVMEFADQRIFVFGEVKQPGAYDLRGSMTVLDAIARAGGTTNFGRKDSIILIRKSEDGTFKGARINLEKILEEGGTGNLYLMPRDVIYVPMTYIAKVDVFVDQFFSRLSPALYFYIAGHEVFSPEGRFWLGR